MTGSQEYGSTLVQPSLAWQIPPAQMIDDMRAHLDGMPYRWFPYVPAGPIVLPRGHGRELASAAASILRLAHEAVRRLGDDVIARHRALGMDDELTVLYTDTDFEDRYATIISRSDVILSADGWKFAEVNVDASVGGQGYVYLLDQFWERALPQDQRGRPRPADPLTARSSLLRDIAAELGAEPSVAVIGCADDIGLPTLRYYEVELIELERAGFRAEYFELADYLAECDAPGSRFPLALQEFVPQDWVDDGRSVAGLGQIRRAGTAMLAPQSSYQVANKRVLAALSAGMDWMSQQDREVVARHVPWTREVVDGEVSYAGRRWDMPRLLADRQELFVLKPPDKNSANGVCVGRVTEAAQWAATLSRALDAGNWVVQEYVVSEQIPINIVDARTSEYVQVRAPVVFGPFMIGGRMAGCWARFDVLNRGGVIILSGQESVHMTNVSWQDGP